MRCIQNAHHKETDHCFRSALCQSLIFYTINNKLLPARIIGIPIISILSVNRIL